MKTGKRVSGGKQISLSKTHVMKEYEPVDPEEGISWFVAVAAYINYAVLLMFGHLRDFFGRILGNSRYMILVPPAGFAPLLGSFENFYTRRAYHRIQDVFNRPVCSAPANRIEVCERVSPDGNKTLNMKGVSRNCLNLGSYNYLGFADDWMNIFSKSVLGALDSYNVSTCSAPMDFGTTSIHKELEETVAEFVGKPAAILYNIGYAANQTTIPALFGKGCLIISDALNHTSIVNGARGSGAVTRVFKHNDFASLEDLLRREITRGQPRTHRPWKKIVVIVEGIYSMEGHICDLKAILKVTKTYKAYLYVDEAHSVGALGLTGRGICEYAGVDPADVDILMGTFTKSFGGMGGYIAGSTELIEYLRQASAGSINTTSMSPVVCKQVVTALNIVSGNDGTDIGKKRLKNLRENSNMFREGLIKMGLQVLSSKDSPVIPAMLFTLSKIAAFSRECFDKGLAVVTVGFPATPLLLARVRFCISAAHTKKDIEDALRKIEEVADKTRIKYLRRNIPK